MADDLRFSNPYCIYSNEEGSLNLRGTTQPVQLLVASFDIDPPLVASITEYETEP